MADAEGYRQNSDAPASNEILRSIIFNKLPLLNSPGELIPNTLYYDARNCSVQAAEQTNFFGRDRIQFNNKDFGSSPSVHIPNVFFTNTCFVIMELNSATAAWKDSQTSGIFYMPHGWGFYAIENIVYYLGSSSVANIQISGVANMIYHLASCETLSKKLKMMDGAGQMLNSTFPLVSTANPNGQSFSPMAPTFDNDYLFRNAANVKVEYESDTVKYSYRNIVDPTLGVAVVPIRLPFSSMCAMEKRISFDTKLLQQPIQITLTLRRGDKLMTWNPADFSGWGELSSSLKSLTFQSYQQGLSDQSLSLRNELLANPRFSVGVPFQYIQDMTFNVLESQEGKYVVNITSMLNADLTTIQFGLRWDKDISATATDRFAPNRFIEMLNVQLLLNGQRLHNYDLNTYPFVYLANNISEYWGKVKTAVHADQPAQWPAEQRVLQKMEDIYVYEINFSRLRAAAMEAHMMNTPRFTNQTMQLGFELNLGYPNFAGGDLISNVGAKLKNPNLVLTTSYYYNAVFMVGQDGGQSKLVTA